LIVIYNNYDTKEANKIHDLRSLLMARTSQTVRSGVFVDRQWSESKRLKLRWLMAESWSSFNAFFLSHHPCAPPCLRNSMQDLGI